MDFIHRVEFGEVSGHRVLIKRVPGNRGPTECRQEEKRMTEDEMVGWHHRLGGQEFE